MTLLGFDDRCVLELKMHVCVHVKIMKLYWDLMTDMCWNWECMCVFMLKPCNSVGIWRYIMCWNWECMCVFMLKPCNSVGIWWYIICWNWKCMCVLQRMCDSLPKLICLQRISIRCLKCVLQWIFDSLPKIEFHAANLWFNAEMELPAAN
jgi:hypothetical protein